MLHLNELPLSHLHVVRALNDLTGTPVAALQDTIGYYRDRYRGTLIANLGFDKHSANAAIESGKADLVSFGKPFIANPDFVRRARLDLPLGEADPQTFYQGEAHGYLDYPNAA